MQDCDFRILHVSDLHYGESHYFRQGPSQDRGRLSLAESIKNAIRPKTLDFLILSGDFFCNKAPSEWPLAQSELKSLQQQLEIPTERILCIPGNHDLVWGSDFPALHLYDQILANLGLNEFTSEQLPKLVTIPPSGARKGICIILLNSCTIDGPETAGLGRITDPQMDKVGELLGATNVTAQSHHILAVLHHHLLPVWHAEDILNNYDPRRAPVRTPSLTVDAVEVLRRLSEWGASAALHGHQHRSAILTYQNHVDLARPIHILGAGSSGDKYAQRHFFMYELQRGVLEAIPYVQSSANPAFFTRSASKSLRLETGSDDICGKGYFRRAEVQERRKSLENGTTIQSDESDLYYLLMTVTDCDRVRARIRRFIELYSVPSGGPFYIKLQGMYDLLGKWDLAVRIRVGGSVKWQTFFTDLYRTLKSENFLYKKAADNFVQDFNILCERASFAPDAPWISEEQRAVRRGPARQYEEDRCQKAFLYIELPSDFGGREDLIERLGQVDRSLQEIIVCVCESKSALILELFLSCCSSLINALNRELGRILASDSCQKYTLLCYEHDEEETVRQSAAPNAA